MRSVYKLIALFLFIGNTAVHAQKPDWQWAVTPAATSFNSSPVGVAVTPNGNLIMAGTFGGSVTFGNTLLPYGPIYIVEYDRNGNVIWAKATGGGTTSGVTPTSIALSPTGEIYIAGSFSAPTLTFGSTTLSLAGAQDVFLAKFDSTGNALWAKSAKSDGGATANSVCTDRSGNVAITGSYITTLYIGSGSLTPQPSSIDNVFIAKYNTSGTLQWAHTAGSYGQDDHGTGIAADTFGNFFITGDFSTSMGFGSVVITGPGGDNDVFIAKYTSAGAVSWAKAAGGTESDFGIAVTTDLAGNVLVTGQYYSNPMHFGTLSITERGNTNIYVAKYTNAGTPVWAKGVGGSDNDDPIAIAADAAGNAYVSGYSSSFDAVFDTIHPFTNIGANKFFIAKFDATAGTVDWAKCDYTSTATEAAPHIAVDACSEVYAATGYNGSLSFLPSPALPYISYSTTILAKIGTISVASVKATCDGGSNGSATVTTLAPGTAPFTYLWSNGSTTQTATGLPTGTNTVTVTDATGCVNKQTLTIGSVSDMQATFSDAAGACSGSCIGHSVVTPTGGFTPYAYLWDATAGNQTSALASNLCPATYNVTITDSLGCSKTFTTKLNTNPSLSADVYITGITSVDSPTLDPVVALYYHYDVPAIINTNFTNPENFVDPGRTVRLKMKCFNNKTGGTDMSAAQCIARTNSPFATITDSVSSFALLSYNGAAWADDEIELSISSATPRGSTIYIDLLIPDGSNTYKNSCIAIPVSPLVMSPSTPGTITDNGTGNSSGNGNGICEDGETIEFNPMVNNPTYLRPTFVRSQFKNLDGVPYINIWNQHSGVAGVVEDTTWWSQNLPVNPGTVNGRPYSNFVFDYSNPATEYNFTLYNVFNAGFRLSNTTGPYSPFRWTAPFTFNYSATGIKTTTPQEEITIYPNPSTGSFTIALPAQIRNSSVTIMDMAGKTILRRSYTTGTINLSLDLPSGTYMACITDDNTHQNQFRKIVITR